MFKLVIQDDEGKTTVVPLIRDEITIGRKEGNTIRLTERNVSRRHARILRNNGEVHIEDLGSYNGIRVNNARIAERVSLRVSDQVQIGDYKLYLKAEGVEQVDDARTMPIERIDAGGGPTDIMPSVAAGQTAPMGVPTTPSPTQQVTAQVSAAAPMVGSPNRTLAIADTDPQGRPVASAAAVAALTAPVGYGKLVCLSSNFAGKEFELSRPQMIVGRTEENDLVINHRSISRNHAKIVREPETGRYTISDLQSSNGVRVNMQDYGKVELRRGDVIDLGHVRLRFVEPGEDFVFARDAVITDIPETGGKRGLLVAIALGVLVLATVIIVFAMRSDDKKATAGGPNGSSGQLDGSGTAGSQVAATDPGSAITEPTVPVDAAPAVIANDPTSEQKALCSDLAARRKWQDLRDCADKLRKLDAKAAEELIAQSTSETKHMVALEQMRDGVRRNRYADAAKAYAKIPSSSVYFKDAESEMASFTQKTLDFYGSKAEVARKSDRTCRAWEKVLGEIKQTMGKDYEKQVRSQVSCERETVASTNNNNTSNKDPNPNPTPNPPSCNADALVKGGQDAMGRGEHAVAFSKFNEAYNCRPSGNTANLAFLAACNSRNSAMAKKYFPKISNAGLTQRCVANNVAFQ